MAGAANASNMPLNIQRPVFNNQLQPIAGGANASNIIINPQTPAQHLHTIHNNQFQQIQHIQQPQPTVHNNQLQPMAGAANASNMPLNIQRPVFNNQLQPIAGGANASNIIINPQTPAQHLHTIHNNQFQQIQHIQQPQPTVHNNQLQPIQPIQQPQQPQRTVHNNWNAPFNPNNTLNPQTHVQHFHAAQNNQFQPITPGNVQSLQMPAGNTAGNVQSLQMPLVNTAGNGQIAASNSAPIKRDQLAPMTPQMGSTITELTEPNINDELPPFPVLLPQNQMNDILDAVTNLENNSKKNENQLKIWLSDQLNEREKKLKHDITMKVTASAMRDTRKMNRSHKRTTRDKDEDDDDDTVESDTISSENNTNQSHPSRKRRKPNNAGDLVAISKYTFTGFAQFISTNKCRGYEHIFAQSYRFCAFKMRESYTKFIENPKHEWFKNQWIPYSKKMSFVQKFVVILIEDESQLHEVQSSELFVQENCHLFVASFMIIKTIYDFIVDMKQHRYADQYNDYKLRYNVQWRCDILKHFALIFIDIFFVPLFICCLLSVYQGIELVHLLQDTKQWNETRMMTIRKQILINFMLLILDIVCTLPLLLILICTLYRLCFVAQRLRHSWRVYDHNRAIRIRNLDEMGSNLVGVGNETPEVDTISPMRICSAPDHDSGTSSTRKKTPQSVRIDILYNVLLVLFIDIPFMLVSVVVIALTVYRIPKCLALIRESEIEIKNLDAFVADTQVYSILLHCRWRIFEHFVGVLLDIPCLALCLVLMMTLWRSRIMYRILRADVESYAQFRSATVVQTMCLIRDILFVAPCAVIVVTLWRLPILIYHLMSKYKTPRVANDEAIHFTLKRCTLEVPMNGAPMIHIAADKHAAFTLNDDDFDAHCRLFVLNSRLWESVTDIFGAFLSVVVQSQIANVHCAARDMQREIEMTITLQSAPQNMNRDTARQVLEELMGIERGDLPFVLQLEHDTKGVLFVVRASVNDLLRCAAADGTVDIAIDTALSELRALSGQEEYDALVGSFYLFLRILLWSIEDLTMYCFTSWKGIETFSGFVIGFDIKPLSIIIIHIPTRMIQHYRSHKQTQPIDITINTQTDRTE
eukprot:31813_1